MILYLTYNDTPSGIYSSQVIDVVKFLNSEFQSNVKLVAFISLRGFLHNRKKIKNEFSEAIVLPMIPGVKRWKWNIILLYLISFLYKPTTIIGRSVLATQLALKLRSRKRVKKVVYDGRGAITAEWNEYKVVTDAKMLSEIHNLENEVVNLSDFRIAVSRQLIKLWQKEFNYQSLNHVVIPCTLNNIFEDLTLSNEKMKIARQKFNFDDDDVVYVYSGSIAGWQSFDILNDFLKKVLSESIRHKILFLSDKDKHISHLHSKFPNQVFNIKVPAAKVPEYLIVGNFGLLLREQSITNLVASPVKFAEYLAAGLTVIISKNLGDYSDFVIEHKCGYLYDAKQFINIDKLYIRDKAVNYFCKRKYNNEYKKVLMHAR